MSILKAMMACGLLVALTGCTTSSKVQEMIDASQRDFLQKSAENANSIGVLKQTAKDSLEKDREHAARMKELTEQLAKTTATLDELQSTAEAVKVMSANSVVQMAELKKTVGGNKESVEAYVEKMRAIDDLYEQVMISHFQTIADSASAAVASLQADYKPDEVDPVLQKEILPLAEPIEIVAPDTSASTNAVVTE